MAPRRLGTRPQGSVTNGATGSAPTTPARRGRGRPPGSRSRSRSGTSVSPIRRRGRPARAGSRSGSTSSVSLSPIRRRGRPPSSRNRDGESTITQPRDREDAHVHHNNIPIASPLPQASFSVELNWLRHFDEGSLVGPSQSSAIRHIIHRYPTRLNRSTENVERMVNQMFEDMHANDLNRISENLSQINLNQGLVLSTNDLPRPCTLGSQSPSLGTRLARSLDPSFQNLGPFVGPSNGGPASEPQQSSSQPPILPQTPPISSGLPMTSSPEGTRNSSPDLEANLSLDLAPAPDDPDWQLVQSNLVDTQPANSIDTLLRSSGSVWDPSSSTMSSNCVQCSEITGYVCDWCSMSFNNGVGSELEGWMAGYMRFIKCFHCSMVWGCWCRRETEDFTWQVSEL
ncbi:hypothetical protein TWF281_002336 [Arthrobotrys megalospora]